MCRAMLVAAYLNPQSISGPVHLYRRCSTWHEKGARLTCYYGGMTGLCKHMVQLHGASGQHPPSTPAVLSGTADGLSANPTCKTNCRLSPFARCWQTLNACATCIPHVCKHQCQIGIMPRPGKTAGCWVGAIHMPSPHLCFTAPHTVCRSAFKTRQGRKHC